MGSRASQLRNRQQVQDSSAASAVLAAGDAIEPANLKRQLDYHTNSVINNNNNVDFDADVTKLKDALHEIGEQIVKENGGSLKQSDSQELRQQVNGVSSSQPSKVSTLQRQASHIQSLAQRIRRSSSLRAPKLKALIPSFVTGRRKVSLCHKVCCSREISDFVLDRGPIQFQSYTCKAFQWH